MRYLTHQFAHSETLDRACRWLIHVGVYPPIGCEVHHHGVPRLAVAAEAGEAAERRDDHPVAEMNDPDGLPGFWDLARLSTSIRHRQRPSRRPRHRSASSVSPASFVARLALRRCGRR